MSGQPFTDETKQKMSDSAKKRLVNPENNSFFGKHHSEETKNQLSELAKQRFSDPENHPMFGTHFSEESKQKMSIAAKKRLSNPENHPMFGKHISEETRAKLSIVAKERTGSKNPRARAVAQYSDSNELIAVYTTITEAHNITGAPVSSIHACCNNRMTRAGGFIWKYVDKKD